MKNRYEIRGDETIIFVNDKHGTEYEVKIDTEDLERVKQINLTWKCEKRDDKKYPAIVAETSRKGKNVRIYLGRLIMNTPKNLRVHYLLGDRLDLRKKMLRNSSNVQINQSKDGLEKNISKIRGVHWDKERKLWKAICYINGKNYFLGRYANLEEAKYVVENFRENNMPFSKEAMRRKLIDNEELEKGDN